MLKIFSLLWKIIFPTTKSTISSKKTKKSSLASRDLRRLADCDPRLQVLVKAISEQMDISVLEGYRGEKAQNEAFKAGRSKAKFGQSKHNTTPSRAVDIVPKPVDWNDKQAFMNMGAVIEQTAKDLGIKVLWGGRFKSFFDGPHIELVD